MVVPRCLFVIIELSIFLSEVSRGVSSQHAWGAWLHHQSKSFYNWIQPWGPALPRVWFCVYLKPLRLLAVTWAVCMFVLVLTLIYVACKRSRMGRIVQRGLISSFCCWFGGNIIPFAPFSFHRADKDGSDQLNIIFRLLTNSSSSSDKLCREPCELIYSSHC